MWGCPAATPLQGSSFWSSVGGAGVAEVATEYLRSYCTDTLAFGSSHRVATVYETYKAGHGTWLSILDALYAVI